MVILYSTVSRVAYCRTCNDAWYASQYVIKSIASPVSFPAVAHTSGQKTKSAPYSRQKNNSVGAYSFGRPWPVHRIALIHGGGARIAIPCLLCRPGVDWKYWFVVVCRYFGHGISQNNVHGGATSATICLLFPTTILRDSQNPSIILSYLRSPRNK